jgi:hypothetical protein
MAINIPAYSARVRFSLRAALVFVAMVCVFLGWIYYRKHWARTILLREHAIVAAIDHNVLCDPPGAKVESSSGRVALLPTRTEESLLWRNGGDTVGTVTVELTFGPEAKSQNRDEFVRNIANHYLMGLDELGLTLHDGGRVSDMTNAVLLTGLVYSVTKSTQLDMSVVIIVFADVSHGRGTVTIYILGRR